MGSEETPIFTPVNTSEPSKNVVKTNGFARWLKIDHVKTAARPTETDTVCC